MLFVVFPTTCWYNHSIIHFLCQEMKKEVITMGQFVKLQKGELKELRKINPALVSYNVEMTEVTGGTFWKA